MRKDSNAWPSVSWLRLGLLVGVPLALLLGTRLLAWATTSVKTWSAGETLTASELNGALSALSSAMVDISTDQTIGGTKTFTGHVIAEPNYAVGKSTTSFSTTSTSFVAIPGLVATINTHGQPIMVTVNTNHNPKVVPPGGMTAWAVWTVYRDGTDLGGGAGFQVSEHSPGNNMPIVINFVDNPPPGTHSYIAEMRVGLSNSEIEAGEGGQVQQISAVELN